MLKLKALRNCLKNGAMFGRKFDASFRTIKRANDNRFPMPWGGLTFFRQNVMIMVLEVKKWLTF
jgi:hypothetical protein